MTRILFVYPNKEGYPIIPLGISVLAGILKSSGHEVDLFDATFMMPKRLDHEAREKTGVVLKTDIGRYWEGADSQDIFTEFSKKISLFAPDIIAFSVVENNYGLASKLIDVVKNVCNIPIIVGGIFPTVAPEFFKQKKVDYICIGEGEYALSELARRIGKGEPTDNIDNLMVRKGDEYIENGLHAYYDWQPFTLQNWSIFDKRHLMKPFMGKVWRTGFFEMSRGCPFNCTYCANHVYQKIFMHLGKYHREKPIDFVMREICYMKIKYELELVFFNDENFMMMPDERFREFCEKYKKLVNLPFFIQTRAETLVDERKVRMLKEAGCVTIGIGLESGNRKMREKILNKYIPDSIYMKAFENCNKYGIRTTAYVMIGLPFETEENIIETAEFCRKLKVPSIAISIFAPYHGTELRDMCVKNGFIKDEYDENISVNYTTTLNMPQLTKEKLEELYYKFNGMVYNQEEE